MIRTSTTRLQRYCLPTIASVLLAVSACAGPTVALKPHVGQLTVRKPLDAAPPHKQASKYETLATPEEAVNLYIECIAANDLACALRAYAAHERAARFDFASLARYVMVSSPAILRAPPDYSMFVEMNELRAKAEMAQATKLFVYGLLMGRDPTEVQNVESEAENQSFVQMVNPARLATLRVVRVDQPRQAITNRPQTQAIWKERATREGADQMTERIALYEFSGQFFWSGFQLCRYGKTWRIHDFLSNYAAMSVVWVDKTTVAEYEARLQ